MRPTKILAKWQNCLCIRGESLPVVHVGMLLALVDRLGMVGFVVMWICMQHVVLGHTGYRIQSPLLPVARKDILFLCILYCRLLFCIHVFHVLTIHLS